MCFCNASVFKYQFRGYISHVVESKVPFECIVNVDGNTWNQLRELIGRSVHVCGLYACILTRYTCKRNWNGYITIFNTVKVPRNPPERHVLACTDFSDSTRQIGQQNGLNTTLRIKR